MDPNDDQTGQNPMDTPVAGGGAGTPPVSVPADDKGQVPAAPADEGEIAPPPPVTEESGQEPAPVTGEEPAAGGPPADDSQAA